MQSKAEEEDRILRVWTPLILRGVLIAAAIVLLIGLFAITTRPGEYVDHFHTAQHGYRVRDYGSLADMLHSALDGNPRSIMTLGLMILTLVPLARVAFSLMFFIKSGDVPFIFFTAYVLLGLIGGVMLGRIG